VIPFALSALVAARCCPLLCCKVHAAFSIAVSADFVGTRYVPAATSLRCKADVVTLLDKRAQQYPLREITLVAQERAFGQRFSSNWRSLGKPKPLHDDGYTVVWPLSLVASSY
jgi:hypothetical protein